MLTNYNVALLTNMYNNVPFKATYLLSSQQFIAHQMDDCLVKFANRIRILIPKCTLYSNV